MPAMEHATAAVGKAGEDAAASYLEEAGYRILGRNIRLGKYEIDILAEDRLRQMLVFVEVKARSSSDARYPLRTAVDRRKRSALRQAAARWVTAHEYDGPARTDVIGVAKGSVIEHLMNLGGEMWCT
jgi:putative endonuclease